MKKPKPHASSSLRAALTAAIAALDKKAMDLILLDVRGIADYADYFLVCHGRSDTQVRAISEGMEKALHGLGSPMLGIEGRQAGKWILLDFGDVICHVFHEPVRRFYALERLWGDAPRVKVPGEADSQRQTA